MPRRPTVTVSVRIGGTLYAEYKFRENPGAGAIDHAMADVKFALGEALGLAARETKPRT